MYWGFNKKLAAVLVAVCTSAGVAITANATPTITFYPAKDTPATYQPSSGTDQPAEDQPGSETTSPESSTPEQPASQSSEPEAPEPEAPQSSSEEPAPAEPSSEQEAPVCSPVDTTTPGRPPLPPTQPLPESNADLQQGQYIKAGPGLGFCSLTIADGVGYTAGHCAGHGGDTWKVGDPIYDKQGTKLIGHIAAMKEGFDVIKINLVPGLTTDGEWHRRDYSTLKKCEPLTVRGLGKIYTSSEFTAEPLLQWLNTPGSAATMAPLTTEEGASGGAVLDANNNVVGVNVGGAFDSDTDTNYRGAFVPWHIIDQQLG